MIIKFKIFESYGSGPESELVEQLSEDFIEKYYDKHFAYTDIDDILHIYPYLIWNHVDDERAMSDIIDDESQSREIEEFYKDDIISYINGKYVDDEDREKIYLHYIEDEVDIYELKSLKEELIETKNKKEKKKISKDIEEITNRIDEIRDLGLDELLVEMSEDMLREIISDYFDVVEFVESILKNRYSGYSLSDYIEELFGSLDQLTFNSRDGRDDNWILKYVDEDAVIKEWNDSEEYDHKYETIKDQIENTPELQRKLLKKKKSNALLLFDLFDGANKWNIGDEYDFQKKYIKAYKKLNTDPDAIPVALKNLYDNLGLNSTIEDEYADYLYLVNSEQYNL